MRHYGAQILPSPNPNMSGSREGAMVQRTEIGLETRAPPYYVPPTPRPSMAHEAIRS